MIIDIQIIDSWDPPVANQIREAGQEQSPPESRFWTRIKKPEGDFDVLSGASLDEAIENLRAILLDLPKLRPFKVGMMLAEADAARVRDFMAGPIGPAGGRR